MSNIAETSFLLVDDVPSVRSFLQQALNQLGAVDVIHAEDGRRALERFSQNMPDVVFLDIELPDLDGQIILKEMKSIKSNTHVIMVSAHSSVDNVKAAIDSGASGFIVKPFSPKKVSSVLKSIEITS